MQMNPYLNFNGNCEVAFTFYAQCLGGKIVMMLTHGEAPSAEHVPSAWHKKIMHARLAVGDRVLMGSDSPPGYFQAPTGFYVQLGIDDPAEAERIFQTLSENGTVTMPFEQTFWAYRFGMLVDQFGIPWMVNCETAA
jgi:PhnB protein